MGGCLRVIGWAIGGFVVLVVLGWIYLTLNPPFGSSETGYLSRTEERAFRLSGTTATATYEVTVGAPPSVYANAYDRFEPLAVRVTASTDDGTPLGVHVLPADGRPIEALGPSSDGGVVTWRLDCQRPTEELPCPRRYLVVVAASAALADEVDGVLQVFAEQLFPSYTGTPFAVGIEVDIERREQPDADGWNFAETSGTFALSPATPVAGSLVVAAGMSPSGTGGLVLAAAAVRDGSAMPTGLDAPPPVRLALLDVTGTVMAELPIRPGSVTEVAVPPGSGRHRLIAWWQDRADQAYRVSWQLRVAAVGVPGLAVSAEAEPPPMPIAEVTTSDGVHASGQPGAPEQAQELPLLVDIGPSGGQDHLPPMVGVMRLRLLLVDRDRPEPVVVRLVPARESGLASVAPVPVVLEPGEPREVVMEAAPGCPATTCPTWAFLPADRGPTGELAYDPALVEWQASVQLWPLDPFAAAAR